MRVNIDEIKDKGVRRSWDLSREELDEFVKGDRAGYRASAAAHVEATLSKLERRVRLDAHARAPVTVACGRCLRPLSLDVPVEFELTLVPAEEAAEDAEHEARDTGPVAGSFDAASVDEETYSGKVIDLDPIVREQIALALPAYPVCKDDCKGLCPACGTNLNDRECDCDRHVPDPRWAGLEKLKLQ